MWIAATLRLPDHVEAGATQLEDLAERGGADPDSLRRLLRYLVARGVFAEMDGGYANTDLSRLLVEEFGWRPWLDLDGAPGVWAESWTRLLEGVRTGSPGRDESWYYNELARTGRCRSFDDLMAAQVETHAQQVANEYDWSSVTHTVDVGGGTGVMLRTLLDAHPHLRGTLFDLPQVVAGVEPVERLEIVAGNLFDDPLPQGQAYVLSQIVHGYPDERAAEVLSRCAEAGGNEVRILLVWSATEKRCHSPGTPLTVWETSTSRLDHGLRNGAVRGRRRRRRRFAMFPAEDGVTGALVLGEGYVPSTAGASR